MLLAERRERQLCRASASATPRLLPHIRFAAADAAFTDDVVAIFAVALLIFALPRRLLSCRRFRFDMPRPRATPSPMPVTFDEPRFCDAYYSPRRCYAPPPCHYAADVCLCRRVYAAAADAIFSLLIALRHSPTPLYGAEAELFCHDAPHAAMPRFFRFRRAATPSRRRATPDCRSPRRCRRRRCRASR